MKAAYVDPIGGADWIEIETQRMHHVFCDWSGEDTTTPSYMDAAREFKRMVRENPNKLVEWWHDDMDGEHRRVACCDPT